MLRSMAAPALLTLPFLLCFAGNFCQSLCFNLFLHLPGHLRALGADELQIGWLTGLISVAAIAVRPPIGRVMDAHGRRGVILAGGALNVVVCVLYGTIESIGPALVLVRMLHGVAEAMLFSAFFTLAADHVPESRRTEGLALFGVSGILPIALGGWLGDVILARANYGALFSAAAVFAAASFLLSPGLRDVRIGTAEQEPSRGVLAALRQPDLAPLWMLGIVFATALAAVFTFVKTFVLDTGLGSVGLFFGAYSAAAVVLRLFFGRVPERIGPKRALFPALGALVVGLAGLAFARSAAAVTIAGVFTGFGHGFTFPILSGLVVERARAAERGLALSLFTALFDVGGLFGAPLFGALLATTGYATMYGTAAALALAGAVAFAFVDPRALATVAAIGEENPGVRRVGRERSIRARGV